MKKPILCVVSAVLVTTVAVGALAGCGSGNELAFHYYYSETDDLGNIIDKGYNHDLVYQNDLTEKGADPSAIYVTEGEEQGYYYMYSTSDPIGATGYLCYRSKNLNDWECMGVAYNPTMYIEDGITYSSFSTAMYWAPEVIYDAEMGLYLMFYNASFLYNPYKFYIDVAVSESPKGPFVQYAKWITDSETATDEQKQEWAPVVDNDSAHKAGLGDGKLKVFRPLLDFARFPAGTQIDESWYKGDSIRKEERDKDGNLIRVTEELPGYMKVIDASPFIDEDGEKYLYFTQDLGDYHSESAICVIKMNDDWTPDYTQMKKLTVANQQKIEDNKSVTGYPDYVEGNTNEAPFMVRRGNKYYLMLSVNQYTQIGYSVRVAVGDSPMGPFTKLTREEGGWLLYREGEWMSGTGHHSIVNANGSSFIVYHAHIDRKLGSIQGGRAFAFDEIQWVTNQNGLEVPHCNGPTYSHMPLITGDWKNIAADAEVECTNVAEGSDAKYLNDGIIKIHDDTPFIKEFEMKEGAAEITLTFEDYREVTGLFIANSYSYDLSVGRISNIEFKFKDGDYKGTASTGDLLYDWNKYYPGQEYYVTGGTFAIEFKPMLVKSITITLPKVSEARALSEIMVLGK